MRRNIHPLPRAGKYMNRLPSARNTHSHRQGWENINSREKLHQFPNTAKHKNTIIHLLPRAEKITPIPKHGKRYPQCQTWKNIQSLPNEKNVHLLPSAGNITATAIAKCGKDCNHCQARENIKHSATRGKHGTGNKQVKSAKSTTR